MNFSNIHPISYLKTNTSDVVKQVLETRDPVAITVSGRVQAQYALNDLQDIRDHLKLNQSPALVKKATQEILSEVNSLQEWHDKGSFVPELEELHLTMHRQLLAGQNRIIVEYAQDDSIYVHIIAHTSRDLEALILRRLLTS